MLAVLVIILSLSCTGLFHLASKAQERSRDWEQRALAAESDLERARGH